MNRHSRLSNQGLMFIVLCIVLVIGLFSLLKYSDNIQSARTAKIQAANDKLYAGVRQKKEEEEKKLKELQQFLADKLPGIVSWGDSLTIGAGGNGVSYPGRLQELITENVYNIPVVNAGVGGESSITIAGRSGAIPYMVKRFTVPANQTPVQINIFSSNGSDVSPLRQGDIGSNPCIINGVEGIISIQQETSTSKEYSYYFTRSVVGGEVEVKDDTIITPSSFSTYKNYLPLIFIGQNGGWSDFDDLKDQIHSIIDSYGDHERYLVLGLTTGTANERADLEDAMLNEFGNQYINLREYISTDGINDAGLTSTEDDKKAISVGSIPPSLLSDAVHFNANGYTIIGNAVYNRMKELGYFDEIIDYLNAAK